MSNNAKVGGILSIVSGSIGVLGVLMMVFSLFVILGMGETTYHNYDGTMTYDEFSSFMIGFYTILSILGIMLSVLAIVGGVFALKKKVWGLALAGSIASILTFFPCGIPAIVFIALGKREFNAPEPLMTAPVQR